MTSEAQCFPLHQLHFTIVDSGPKKPKADVVPVSMTNDLISEEEDQSHMASSDASTDAAMASDFSAYPC